MKKNAKSTSFRIRDEYRALLARLAEAEEKSQVWIIEDMIRERAAQRGIKLKAQTRKKGTE